MLLWNNIFPDNITAFTTDVSQDFSFRDNQLGLTSAEIEYLEKNIKTNVRRFINIRQVHQDRVLCIDKQNLNNDSLIESDGLTTNLSNIALIVRTADCLPVFLYDPRTNSIGIVHAGWKGSQLHVVPKAISQMVERFGVKTEDIQILLGPCIGRCCYEVGKEFKGYFAKHVEEKKESFYLDLKGVNRDQLLDSGVDEHNIFDSEVCTCCDNSCHSFRRDQSQTGRMISLIMLQKNNSDDL